MKGYINKIISDILDNTYLDYLFFYTTNNKNYNHNNEIYINIPYFDKKDINITYDSNDNKIQVSINDEAYKSFMDDENIPMNIKYSINKEYTYYLPKKINEKSIHAELKNGILKITYEENKEGKYKIEIK